MTRAALALLLLCARVAAADPEGDADAAFKAAGEKAAAGDPGAIDAYEAIGKARPITTWTDDAWSEAGRLAELSRDYDRARRDLEQVVAVGTDVRLVARAKGSLARIAEQGGREWDAVRAAHEKLVSEVYGGGDPRPALHSLAALVRANPQYPRANAARLTLGLGWESEGDREEAIAWFAEAANDPRARAEVGQHIRLEHVRALVRMGYLDEAEAALGELDPALVDRGGEGQAAGALETARHRAHVRLAIALALVLLAAGALVLGRRDAGGWRALAKRFLRPPTEVWFLAPLAVLLMFVAMPGNPLVARAVRWIGVAGVGIAWMSGVLLDAARARGPLGARRAVLHAVIVGAAVAGAVYLVVDGLALLDLLGETWRAGPAMQ